MDAVEGNAQRVRFVTESLKYQPFRLTAVAPALNSSTHGLCAPNSSVMPERFTGSSSLIQTFGICGSARATEFAAPGVAAVVDGITLSNVMPKTMSLLVEVA